jgi:hypothetical protein
MYCNEIDHGLIQCPSSIWVYAPSVKEILKEQDSWSSSRNSSRVLPEYGSSMLAYDDMAFYSTVV